MTQIFFFDSYALIEIAEENSAYERYKSCTIVTTKMNIFEVYYYFLRTDKEEEGRTFVQEYIGTCVTFDAKTILKAGKLRKERAKQKLSMTDCIGYISAEEHGIKFLTGDKEFEDLPNVEFVTKIKDSGKI